ncbi:MAG: D-tyrosyl-tRNA(Tyr) deacylase [Candidatus Hydrogenedentes bacterium]|nr:D-tyrosyl-tRNA(Tyr) deacylase [Candidatus Hydrogenedentota bacterium]
MRAVIQRVAKAQVSVDNEVCAKTGKGLVVLLGVERNDTDDDAAFIARKVAHLRIFEDETGKMNFSVCDIGGSVLLVSQFTLLGDCRKGNRPSFTLSAQPEVAEPLVMKVCDLIKSEGVPVQTGVFGAVMDVELVNAGPVTIVLDSRKTT